MNRTLLIIDDEATFGQLLSVYFQSKGYDVLLATDGPRGLWLAAERQPDLVILDVMMPGMDGWEVLRRLREISDTPTVMLTAKTGQDDVIHGLSQGADDYVKKPFDLRELELRIEAILRRYSAQTANGAAVYHDDNLRIDLRRRQVQRRGQSIHLTPTEFRLLGCLVQHRDRVVPHKELVAEVWGPSYVGDTRSLSLYIRYLREKLEDDPANPRYIRTDWGVGYRFMPAFDFGRGPALDQ
jgi:two-component system KDP operon response regulator KdpE